MATILQCKFCGKPFQSLGGKVCESCLDQIDKDYLTIKDYIYDNPGIFDLDKLSEETGIRKKIILYLIEQQRLVLDQPKGQGFFKCSACRKPIEKGTMCEECRESLASKLNAVLPKKEAEQKQIVKPTGIKMHANSTEDKKKR